MEDRAAFPADDPAVATAELLRRIHEAAREASDERWSALERLWHRRSETEVFEAAQAWCRSAAAFERSLGADLLAKLAQDGHPLFADVSVPEALRLLHDPDPRVLESAVYALNHLRASVEVRWEATRLRELARHASPDVRLAVAVAVGFSAADPLGVEAEVLMALMTDTETDVRDWATFGLAQSEADSERIREALAQRLEDEDDETRGEALVGLARRRDPRVVSLVLEALQQPDVSGLVIEAAEEMPQGAFVPHLEALLSIHPGDSQIESARDACRSYDSGMA